MLALLLYHRSLPMLWISGQFVVRNSVSEGRIMLQWRWEQGSEPLGRNCDQWSRRWLDSSRKMIRTEGIYSKAFAGASGLDRGLVFCSDCPSPAFRGPIHVPIKQTDSFVRGHKFLTPQIVHIVEDFVIAWMTSCFSFFGVIFCKMTNILSKLSKIDSLLDECIGLAGKRFQVGFF